MRQIQAVLQVVILVSLWIFFVLGIALPFSYRQWREALCQVDVHGVCECPNQARSCDVEEDDDY
jgi:hypothetical protein